MDQMSVPFDEKLDMPLVELFNAKELSKSTNVPVVIRSNPAAFQAICEKVMQLGGKVRHEIPFVGAIAVWIPMFALTEITKMDEVSGVELEQQFTIA